MSAPKSRRDDLEIERVGPEDVFPLRTRVFRPLLVGIRPFRHSLDDAESARHFAARNVRGADLAVVSFLPDPCPECDADPSFRLFSCAVDPKHRGNGVGFELCRFGLDFLVDEYDGEGLVWGNARLATEGFWERLGFGRRGGLFRARGEPHVVMAMELVRFQT